MRIDVQGLGFPLTAALLNHTERRLRFALTRTSDRIMRVVVRLGDANGPRGGEDKFCRMQVHLQRAAPVLIEDAGVDLYAVIDRVAERAGRSVAKRIDRRHDNARLAGLEPLGSPPGDAIAVRKSQN